MKNSYFDGGLATYIGTSILATLITVFTLGICAPWGICMMYNWKIKHTVIDGKRLYFDGTAMQLFGHWIKWLLLTIITLGIWFLVEYPFATMDYKTYPHTFIKRGWMN